MYQEKRKKHKLVKIWWMEMTKSEIFSFNHTTFWIFYLFCAHLHSSCAPTCDMEWPRTWFLNSWIIESWTLVMLSFCKIIFRFHFFLILLYNKAQRLIESYETLEHWRQAPALCLQTMHRNLHLRRIEFSIPSIGSINVTLAKCTCEMNWRN